MEWYEMPSGYDPLDGSLTYSAPPSDKQLDCVHNAAISKCYGVG